jgi:hypothetical protein
VGDAFTSMDRYPENARVGKSQSIYDLLTVDS